MLGDVLVLKVNDGDLFNIAAPYGSTKIHLTASSSED